MDKFNDENYFNAPVLMSKEECRDVYKNGIYRRDRKEFEIKKNRWTTVSYFSVGSMSYSTTNIECQGQSLRLKSGKVVKNMLREISVQLMVEEVSLFVDNGEVSLKDGHWLGYEIEGNGQEGINRVVWDIDNNERCKKAVLTKMKMSSTDEVELYNHEHLVQLRKKSRGYDTKCKLTYFNTDMTGIYLVEEGSKVRLPTATGESVSLNAQVQTQINYLDGELKRRFEDRYQLGRDPLCEKILSGPIHETVRTEGSRFVRNMGDLSVSFKCEEVIVKAANTTKECYKQIRVEDGENLKYLDAATRILLENGSKTVCSPASIPAILDTKGRTVIYDPKPRVVNPTKIQNMIRHEDYVEGKGLYAPNVVEEWLKFAYLGSYHEKYYVDFGGDTEDGRSKVDDKMSAINEAYEITKKYNLRKLILGLDMERIGRNCSIAVCVMVGLYAIYKVLDWGVKTLLVFGRGDTGVWTSIFIAVFTQFHLLSEEKKKKIRNECQVEEVEMENMGNDGGEEGEVE